MNTIWCVLKIVNAVSFIISWKKLTSQMITFNRCMMNWGLNQGHLVQMVPILVFHPLTYRFLKLLNFPKIDY